MSTPDIVPICALQICKLQIFSGCVCDLEQLDAQSPFLFPIVFGINLSPFFRYWLSTRCPLLGYVLLYLGHGAFADVTVCGFGGWALVFHCGLPCKISPSLCPPPPKPLSNRGPGLLNDGRKHRIVFFLQSDAVRRISTSYRFAAFRYRLTPILQTVHASVGPRLLTETHKAEKPLKGRSVVP